MRIALDLNYNVIDDIVNGVDIWNQGGDDVRQRGGHGCTHHQQRLADDGKGALPEIGHMSGVTVTQIR